MADSAVLGVDLEPYLRHWLVVERTAAVFERSVKDVLGILVKASCLACLWHDETYWQITVHYYKNQGKGSTCVCTVEAKNP